MAIIQDDLDRPQWAIIHILRMAINIHRLMDIIICILIIVQKGSDNTKTTSLLLAMNMVHLPTRMILKIKVKTQVLKIKAKMMMVVKVASGKK